MLKLFALVLLLVVGLFFWVKARVASVKDVEPIEPQAARTFGDQVLDDFIHDRRDAIYEKLETGSFSREKFEEILDQLDNHVGKITQYEFMSDTGKVSLLSQTASREMTYKVTTTQGKHYPFTLTLISHQSELAIQEFHFSTFQVTYST